MRASVRTSTVHERLQGSRSGQVAALLEVDPSTVREWEMGLRAPSRRSAEQLEEWLPRIAGTWGLIGR